MNCPKCGRVTTVKESRADGYTVYRSRKCHDCDYTFYTTETIGDDTARKRLRRVHYEQVKQAEMYRNRFNVKEVIK